MTAAKETLSFQADLSQMMSLLINSVYQNSEVHLREMISNASDAIDKIRHLSLTNPAVLGEEKDLKITIKAFKDEKILEIHDTGIGMTKAELVNNLGTIARSGTKAFMEAFREGAADISMIGQFGVGFYSAFLVANRVQVISKSSDDCAYIWESSASGVFSIEPDNSGTIPHRGTIVRLFVKDDQTEYLEEAKIREIVKRYSSFIQHPIYLLVNKTVEVDVTDDEAEKPQEEDEVKIEEVDEKKKTKKVTNTVQELDQLNKTKPIWIRKSDQVTEDEYKEFYKAFSNDWEDYLAVKHFSVEGSVEFYALLFIPRRAPFDLFEGKAKHTNISLHLKRVFITNKEPDIIPMYLNFVKGIVDSEDLPLNLSRDHLQRSKIITVIRKKLVAKIIEVIADLAQDKESYKTFYEAFSKSIKLGIHEDTNNREKLSDFLRYNTTKSLDELCSLDDYITRMPENQTQIYYIIGETMSATKTSPFLAEFKKRGFEVLLMTDPIDEYMMQNLKKYKGKEMVCITKENVKLPDLTEEEKKGFEELKAEFEPLCKFFKEVLGDKVEKVIVSERAGSAPAILCSGEFGWSANLDRIMRNNALRNTTSSMYMASRKTMEVNPRNSIIKSMKSRYDADAADKGLSDLVMTIYEATMLASGFTIDQPASFVNRVIGMIKVGLSIEDSEVEEEPMNQVPEAQATTMEEVD